MRDAGGHSPQHSLRRTVERWVDHQVTYTMSVLSRALFEWAMSDDDRASALVFFKNHKYLEKNREQIIQHFAKLVNNAIDGKDPSIEVIPQQRPSIELQKLMEATGHHADCRRLLSAIRPEVFATLFQRAFNLIDPHPDIREVAKEVFHTEFSLILAGLYECLLQEWEESKALADGPVDHGANITAWVRHLENKLADPTVDRVDRALTQKRLDELNSKLSRLDTLPQSVADFRSRWYYPQREAHPAEYSNTELLAEADNLLKLLATKEGAPDAINELVTRIRPLIEAIALNDLGTFMQALHPAKQLTYQAVSIFSRWQSKGCREKQVALNRLRESIVESAREVKTSHKELAELHVQLLEFVDQEKLNIERVQASKADGRILISTIEDVGTLLEEKLEEYQNIPPMVYQFLFSAWNRVIAQHWVESGPDGMATRKALALVDDIMWYLQCDDKTLHYTDSTSLGNDIEREIKKGLALIDYDQSYGDTMLASIEALRQPQANSPVKSINLRS